MIQTKYFGKLRSKKYLIIVLLLFATTTIIIKTSLLSFEIFPERRVAYTGGSNSTRMTHRLYRNGPLKLVNKRGHSTLFRVFYRPLTNSAVMKRCLYNPCSTRLTLGDVLGSAQLGRHQQKSLVRVNNITDKNKKQTNEPEITTWQWLRSNGLSLIHI